MRKTLARAKRVILSLKYDYLDRFVFIHINRTGGSSVEKALHIPPGHKTALEKIEEMGQENWDKKLTFTIIRNPWDKVVSHYHYRVETNQTHLRDTGMEFKEWVRRTYGTQDASYYDNPRMFMPHLNWISDKDGNILVDEIMRFEKLESDFKGVLNKLGKKSMLPHEKKTDRGDYRGYYDEETIAIVRHWFERDIERFGYEF